MKKIYQKIIATVVLTTAVQVTKAQCPVPSPVTASPATLCSGATTSLNATSVGAAINWYTVPSGGSAIGSSPSGANFSIVPVTTTTYYAESYVSGTTTLNFTGSVQTVTVPAGVTVMTVDVRGAKGGNSNNALVGPGGNGGRITGTISVVGGQVLNIYVGGAGVNGTNVGGTGGYNGGGNGYTSGGSYSGGGGGGASDVRVSPYTLADRVAVAGGGGGGAHNYSNAGYDRGGMGGGATGEGGYSGNGLLNNGPAAGAGGSQVSGGAGGTYTGWCSAFSGVLGIGGNGASGCTNSGGGAGGGYYGGGGGSWAGGGGGSSYLINGAHTQGFQTGNGQVLLSYNGCVSVSRTPVTVTVNANPTITVNSGSICSGNSFTMIPSGANTYTFQGGNAVVSPTASTNYTVAGTNSAGCVSQSPATSSVVVNVSPLPTITVNSGSICSGDSFTMVASGANTYTFQGGSAVVSPTATSSYTVVGTNTAGCISQTFATSNVTVNALPTLSATSSGSICTGSSATLTASGANTYSWNTGGTTSSIVVSPTTTTNYTAIGTSSAGCSGTTTISLVVSPCTGIADNSVIDMAGVNVYPNPGSGILNIKLTAISKDANIQILNLVGQVLINQAPKTDHTVINLTDYPAGVYFVKVSQSGKQQTVKIIKE